MAFPPFQQINKMAQKAVSQAKDFIETTDGEFSEDDASSYLSELDDDLLQNDYSEHLRNFYKDVFNAAVEAWAQITTDED